MRPGSLRGSGIRQLLWKIMLIKKKTQIHFHYVTTTWKEKTILATYGHCVWQHTQPWVQRKNFTSTLNP
jgi:hypothetical protein